VEISSSKPPPNETPSVAINEAPESTAQLTVGEDLELTTSARFSGVTEPAVVSVDLSKNGLNRDSVIIYEALADGTDLDDLAQGDSSHPRYVTTRLMYTDGEMQVELTDEATAYVTIDRKGADEVIATTRLVINKNSSLGGRGAFLVAVLEMRVPPVNARSHVTITE
jgi:hypothetical protein